MQGIWSVFAVDSVLSIRLFRAVTALIDFDSSKLLSSLLGDELEM